MRFLQLSQVHLYSDATMHYIYQHSIAHRFFMRIVIAVGNLCCMQSQLILHLILLYRHSVSRSLLWYMKLPCTPVQPWNTHDNHGIPSITLNGASSTKNVTQACYIPLGTKLLATPELCTTVILTNFTATSVIV